MTISTSLGAAPYKAYFDRDKKTVDGFFSVIDEKTGEKIFDRFPVRSGQRAYTTTSWISGKSPIPFSSELKAPLKISLKSKPLQEDQWAGEAGIGEFWPVYNHPTRTDLIINADGLQRVAIGCHPENSYKGSAGCVVFVNDTEEQKEKLIKLSAFMESLVGVYDYMPFEVL